MNSFTRHLITTLGPLALAAFTADARAFDINQNLGFWTDNYGDTNGVAQNCSPVACPLNGEDPQSHIVHDPFGSLITLSTGQTTGYFYTQPIEPSSFSAWGKIYVNAQASTAGGVTLQVWNGSQLYNAPLIASDDPAYSRMALMPAGITASHGSIRLRLALDKQGSPIAPAVKEAKVKWVPRSVIGVSLDAPTTRPTGDGIVLRIAASVSYVDATDFYAWIPVPGPDNADYTGPFNLSFVSATDGGQYTASGIGPVPANSVYWYKPTLAAGNTFAYYATLRSNNGIVNGIEYTFTGSSTATNTNVPPVTSTRTTQLTSAPQGYLYKTSGNTFILGGRAYARDDALITLRLSPGNWVFTSIPTGAQDWNDVVVYDSLADFTAKHAVGSAGNSWMPVLGTTLVNISNGGTYTAGGVPGLGVPANSVYWTLPRLALGQLESLSYQLQLNGQLNDAVAPGVTINDCTTKEASLASGQYSRVDEHQCAGGGSSCAPITTCHPITIYIDNTPGYLFAKGDQINGSTSIRAAWNDNPEAFVTYGDAITFKLFSSNAGLSRLRDAVLFDVVPPGTTFASAALPPTAGGTIWYYTGAPSSTPPQFFNDAIAAEPTGPGDVTGSWTQNRASVGTVTWVAYWINEIASAYEPIAGVPQNVTADFTVTVNTSGNPCVNGEVANRGYAQYTRYVPYQGSSSVAINPAVSAYDDEPVNVKPVIPNLGSSSMSGPYSGTPGEVKQWTLNVWNHDRNQNQIDSALATTATIDIPKVVANGQSKYLTFLGLSGPGTATYTYDAGSVSRITVALGNVLPEQTKTLTLSLGLPVGIKNATTFSLTSTASASDNLCGNVSASPSWQTTITSAPALEVVKNVDLAVAAPGSTYNYQLRFVNSGTAPSSQTWVIDRIPNGASILTARGVSGGQVWFAPELLKNPSDPSQGFITAVSPAITFDDSFVRARFTRSTTRPDPIGDPDLYAPSVASPRWIAFLVDDATFDPAVSGPILGVGDDGTLDVRVQVSNSSTVGSILTNEGLIDSAELLQSIGNRVTTVISGRPGLALDKECPEVVSNDEEFDYIITWVNDTTNRDDTVTIVETFPEDFEPFLDDVESSAIVPEPDITYTDEGLMRVTWTFPPQGSLGTAFLRIPGVFDDVASHTFETNQVVGIAENASGAYSTSHACTTLVENPELYVRKLVDVNDPRSGETVLYTITVSNEHARRATSVQLDDTLEAGLTLNGGSFQVLTPGWQIQTTNETATSFTAHLSRDNFSTTGLPGNSGPITFTYSATVNGDVPPGTSLDNTIAVSGQPGQDPPATPNPYPDTATVTVKTPLPDPRVTLTAPPLVKLGDNLTYSILYANDAREDASHTVLIFSLPEGPTTDQTADFTYVSHTAPAGVSVYFSSSLLGAISPNDPNDFPSGWPIPFPNGTWSDTPSASTNYVMFVIGDLDAQTGPFPLSVTAAAVLHSGAEVAIGQAYTAQAEIGMVDNDFADDDMSNNVATATTSTPRVDLAVEVACDPDGGALGVLPSGLASFTFTVENTGTVNARGISVDTELDVTNVVVGNKVLALDSSSPSSVIVTDASGTETNPIGTSSARVDAPVAWRATPTAKGTRFYIGNDVIGDAGYYRNLGMKPGDHTTLTVIARVADSARDSTTFSNRAEVIADGQTDLDLRDDVVANNVDTCGSVVYRADPFVQKTVFNNGDCGDSNPDRGGEGISEKVFTNKAIDEKAFYEGAKEVLTLERGYCDDTNVTSTIVDAGDRMTYTIKWGNAGHYEADGVVMIDALPPGTTFDPESMSSPPPGVIVEYAGDGGGDWSTNPYDFDDVEFIRWVWDENTTMPAPANRFFTATTNEDFSLGEFNGTHYQYDQVWPGSEPQVQPTVVNRAIGVEAALPPGQYGPPANSYWSPAFPDPDEEGNVTSWGRVVAKVSFGADADENATISVLDPRNNSVILANVLADYDDNGVASYDLSSLNPHDYPQLRLQATLQGNAQGSCMEDIVPGQTFWGFPTDLDDNDTIIGYQGNPEDDSNITAFVWTGDTGITSLHGVLPTYEGNPGTVWWQSVPTDLERVDDNLTAVGWADPNPSTLSQLPSECGVSRALGTICNIPSCNGSDLEDSVWHIPQNASSNLQFIVDPSTVSTAGKVRITELAMRINVFAAATTRTLTNLKVSIGYANTTSLSPNLSANWYGQPTVVHAGDFTFTTTSDAFVPDIILPVSPGFTFDPAMNLPLLIEVDADGWTSPAGSQAAFGIQFDNYQASDSILRSMFYDGSEMGSTFRRTDVRLRREVVGQDEPLVVWKELDGIWQSACLPSPSADDNETSLEAPIAPTAALVYLNNQGTIAGTWGAEHKYGGGSNGLRQRDDARYGVPTIWCHNYGGDAFDYSAYPLYDYSGQRAPTSVVTGINNYNTVIGVGVNKADGGKTHHGYVWVPEGSYGCPGQYFAQHDLTTILQNALGLSPQADIEATPLGVDDFGYVYGTFINQSTKKIATVVWMPADGTYLAIPVIQDYPQSLSKTLFPNSFVGLATATTDLGYFNTYAFTNVTAQPFGNPIFNGNGNLYAVPSNLGQADVITGSFYYNQLGLASLSASQTKAWARINGRVFDLGEILAGQPHLPLFGNSHNTVVGSAIELTANNAIPTARIFKWSECQLTSDTPRLDEWSVTYETNRPPQFNFDVVVDDYCQAQVVNRVDVSTTTPEISLDNDHSEARIALNQADLEVTVDGMDVVGHCESSDRQVHYTYTLTNRGPGPSRDVWFEFDAPANVIPGGWGWDSDTQRMPDYYYSYSNVESPGYFYGSYDWLDVGESFTVEWDGESIECEAGTLLTATGETGARTVDCVDINDVGSFASVVGEYPNLYVELDGPTTATTGETLTYTVDYGNSGNAPDENAVVTVVLPEGVTYVSASVPPSSFVDGHPVWQLGTLDAGETGSFTLTLGAAGCDVQLEGYFDHLASIEGDDFESSIFDNESLVSTYVVEAAGALVVDAVSSHTFAEENEPVATTVYFTNTGTATVGGAVLTVGIPGGASRYVTGSASPNGVLKGDSIEWQLGTQLPGELGSVTFRYKATAEATPTTASIEAIGVCGNSTPIRPPNLPGMCVCPDDYQINEAGVCVRDLSAEPTVAATQWNVCAAGAVTSYTQFGARFFASTSPPAGIVGYSAAACNDPAVCVAEDTDEWNGATNLTGYLSTHGVWACNTGSSTAGINPINEWIGFSKCITIDEAGDYLVGIAGDNQVLFRLDGQLVWQSQIDVNFETWNVFRVPIAAGTHIIELFGLNEGINASFGAEISGPFVPGTIDTPTQMAAADYAGHIVFSTQSMIGQEFQTSLDASTPSGMTCPDGFALDLCGDVPTCTSHSEVACEEVEPRNLNLFKSASVGTACEGDSVTWNLLVTNTSEAPLVNVLVEDDIPEGLVYKPGSIEGGDDADDNDPTNLSWIIDSIPVGGSATVSYATNVTASETGMLLNEARAVEQNMLARGVSDFEGVTARGAIGINCGPNVALEKTWTELCAADGSPVEVELKVKNGTDAACQNGKLSDHVPAGLDILLPTGTPPPDETYAYDSGARTVTFAVPTLLPGDSATFRFRARLQGDLPAGMAMTNRAAFRAEGLVVQTSNQVATAVPPLVEELCDDADNDCDGLIDEDFALGESCGQGICAGYIICNPATGGQTCNGANPEPKERCGDELDSDCDGDNDNGFEAIGVLPCDANEVSLAHPVDTDLCKNDITVCNPDDNTTTACAPEVFAVETCDGKDENCDGVADEPFLLAPFNKNQPCDGSADSDQCATGVYVCNGAHTGTECNDDSNSTVEACNGIDDDCDKFVDEDWKEGGQGGTYHGPFLGADCDGTNDSDYCPNGTIECNIGFTGVICHEDHLGIRELCNGRDDTCDCLNPNRGVNAVGDRNANAAIVPACEERIGIEIDEGYGVGEACGSSQHIDEVNHTIVDDLGNCRVTGTLQCNPFDATKTYCMAPTPVEPSAETCNGEDDDCDGLTDNEPESTTSVCEPLETEILTGPPPITASTSATFTYINPLADPVSSHTTFQCSLDGRPWSTCNHSGANPKLTYNNLAVGQHTLLVRATRGDGAVDPTPDYWTWVIDNTVPDTEIVVAPHNPSQSGDGTFVFGSPTPNPDFYTCVLDPAGGTCPAYGAVGWHTCPVNFAYNDLADGSHTVCVYVTDTKGTPDPVPASYTWVIDTVPPETEIVATIPPTVTSSTSVTFNYVDPTAPTTNTFECRIDGGDWEDCDGKTTDYTGLTEGVHVFEVRTVDPTGNVDPTPATFTWTIDRTAPCPTLSTTPDDPSQSGTAIFGLTAGEDVTFFCALDPAANEMGANGKPLASAYDECTGTTSFSGLADGSHTLWVYAADLAGNVSTCDSKYTWLIDTRYPETEITDGPTPLYGSGETATLDYDDPTNPDAITFECSLDGAAFKRCDGTTVGDGGTIAYPDLPVGQHTFAVRTCDFTKAPPVQCDPTPATWQWEVTVSPCPNDHTAPGVTCAKDAVLECVDGGAGIDLDALHPATSDTCEPIETTTSASAEIGLGQTPLVFTTTDGNGNTSSCVTLVTVVDVTAPVITCPADVAVGTDPGVCGAAAAIGVATATDACQGSVGILFVDDAPDFFGPGETVVTHHAIDAFGNEATCKQRVTVTDDEDLTLTCSDSATVDAPADKCEWSGINSALAVDNCSDEMTVDVDGTYPVGVTPILFTASDDAGNSAECTTELTVRDVTPPVVTCGEAVGTLPTIYRATSSDACGATVTIENVVCKKVVDGTETTLALADCPVEVKGDAIEVSERLGEGELHLSYQAKAVDPSNNVTTVDCAATYDPDADHDGVVDADDNCVGTPNGDQTDSDGDGFGNACDVCPDVADADQADRDDDGIGDACSDKDKDGVLDIDDNCEVVPNADQLDTDGDETGDVCDEAAYDGLTAEGSGGCAGGAGTLFGGLLGLAGIAVAVVRRRR